MTKREYIPSYGPDKNALKAGIRWFLEKNNKQELFLYVAVKSHLNEGKIIHSTLGESICKTLQKNEIIDFDGRNIHLVTNRSITHIPQNSRILAVHISDKSLEAFEKKYQFDELLIVAWNCISDLPSWIKKHNAVQHKQFLPIDPRKYPGWHKSEAAPLKNFTFSKMEIDEYEAEY